MRATASFRRKRCRWTNFPTIHAASRATSRPINPEPIRMAYRTDGFDLIAEHVSQTAVGQHPDQHAQRVEPQKPRRGSCRNCRPSAPPPHSSPGMNFATSSERTPYFSNAFSVLRTQESGSSAMRHRKFRILAPRRRPSWNQTLSAIRQAAMPLSTTRTGFSCPLRASAPHASSSGIEGSGSAPCSASSQTNNSAYPWRTTNSAV